MAFILSQFSTVGANSAKGQVPSQFSYKNIDDTKDEMLASGYFNEVALSLNTNDVITIVSTEGLGFLHVTSSDPVARVVMVDDDISVTSTSGFYQVVLAVNANTVLTASNNGNLVSVDTSGGSRNITLPDTSTLADDFRVGIVKNTTDSNVISVKRSGADTINGGTNDIPLTTQDRIVDFVGDISTAKYIGNVPSISRSRNFVEIHQISDFPVQSNAAITLQNGVNYLVYIDDPVSTDLTFLLEGNYDQGGSLRYMGNQGVLKWTRTTGAFNNSLLLGGSLVAGSNFLVEGFEFIDDGGVMPHAVHMTGTSTGSKMGNLKVKNCTFKEFKAPFNLDKITESNFNNVTADPSGTTQTASAFLSTDCESIQVSNCDFGTDDSQLALEVACGELVNARFLNTDFRVTQDTGAILLDNADGLPAGPLIFSHCNAFNGANITTGFKNADRGIISSILDSGGFAQITTSFDHAVTTSPDDQIALIGTKNYEGLHPVTAVTASTITLGTSFIAANYSGQFTQGSLDSFSSEFIFVDNCHGIIAPLSGLAIEVVDSSTIQTISAANTFQEFDFPVADIQQSQAGFSKDFRMFEFGDLKVQYTGKESANVRVVFTITTTNGASVELFKFRFDRRLANGTKINESQRWEFTRLTPANEFQSYTFATDIFMNPDDILVPEFLEVTNTNSVIIKTSIFTLRK